MAAIEWVLMITLGMTTMVLFTKAAQQRQQQMQLEKAFYQLLKEENSCIALIQLAAKSQVTPQMAQQYLEQQVQIFDAVLEVDADGDTFYRFPKLSGRSPLE
jgi:hypothetical protein